MIESLIGFAAIFALALLRIPLAFAMGTVGIVGIGLTRGWPLTKAVRLGSAAGAAKLLTPGTAPCTRDDTERLFEQTVNPIDIDPVNS